jgi:transcriptional regulator with XRE-family HTH domain
MTIRDQLALNLAYYRKKAGLTQKGAAAELGTKPTTLSSWERGASQPEMSSLNQHTTVFYGIFRTSEAHQSALQYPKLPTNCPQKKERKQTPPPLFPHIA